MTETPQTQAKVEADIFFDRLPDLNQGPKYISIEFKSMVNGGYIVRGTLADPMSGLLTQLIKEGYLESSRTRTLQMRFRIRSSVNDELATDFQIVNIVSLRARGNSPDTCTLEFIGVDPPSWYLNIGDTAGEIYTGNVKSVIEQVIQKYAPGIDYEIGDTLDSKQNKWAIMRQDPKTFILSLLEWSASITQNKTHWITTVDGGKKFGDRPKIIIKEQAILPSRSRAYYEYWGAKTDSIKDWEFLSDNALSILDTKITTQGISSISGEYLDRITDSKEQKVFVKDSNTPNKKIAATDKKKSTSKPDDSIGSGPQESGWSQVMAIPEFNAGDLGLNYGDYIDGRARGIYLNLVNSLIKMRLGILGHHIWSSGYGLGTDTIFISWRKQPNNISSDTIYFLTGNWIVNGFEHIASRKNWRTNLYISRFDYNAEANRVGI